MYLVYEKNYLSYGDVDCVEETDMELFYTKEDALKEMELRKKKYIEDVDNGFTYMKEESSEDCIVFADELSKTGDERSGEFHICVTELKPNLYTNKNNIEKYVSVDKLLKEVDAMAKRGTLLAKGDVTQEDLAIQIKGIIAHIAMQE